MWIFILKTIAAALIISFCSWLSNRRPDLAGFIVALPLTTLIVLLFSFAEYRDSEKTVEFAKSVFVGVPLTLVFFVPFLMAKKFDLHFGVCYSLGIVLLVSGYFMHGWLMKYI
jgi:hypothetical protein